MSIYKSQKGKEKSLFLYDKQLSKLNMPLIPSDIPEKAMKCVCRIRDMITANGQAK